MRHQLLRVDSLSDEKRRGPRSRWRPRCRFAAHRRSREPGAGSIEPPRRRSRLGKRELIDRPMRFSGVEHLTAEALIERRPASPRKEGAHRPFRRRDPDWRRRTRGRGSPSSLNCAPEGLGRARIFRHRPGAEEILRLLRRDARRVEASKRRKSRGGPMWNKGTPGREATTSRVRSPEVTKSSKASRVTPSWAKRFSTA